MAFAVGLASSSRTAGCSASLPQIVCCCHVEPVVAERFRYLLYRRWVHCALREARSRRWREGTAATRLAIRFLGEATPGGVDIEM